MSGIYIRGMEMPIDAPVIIKICPDGSVSRVHEGVVATAIPVPDHGRLIDAAYAEEHIRTCMGNGRPMYSHDSNEICEMLNDCPTIIPADNKEDV